VQGGFFPVKAQCSGSNDDDACRCRDPLEGIVAATLTALGLRVKTQDLVVSMMAGDGGALLHCYLLGDVVMEPWSIVLVGVFDGKLDAS
jgi:hypothetical protein